MTTRPPFVPWITFVASSFLRHQALILAASLSYTTVLSLVPLLAVAFSVAKGFGMYQAPDLRNVLMRLFAERGEVVDAVLGYIQNTNVKALGVIGVATLFITAFGLLSTMEESFNIIWGADRQRGVWNRFANYLSVVLVCPVFILAAFSMTASLENMAVIQWLMKINLFSWAWSAALKAVPAVMVVMALFIMYKFLPNVEVKALPAMIGAATAGIAWQVTQAVYIKYQIGVSGYNAIYGSFAQIPLLLVWLYISWLIVLAGCEVAYAKQNYTRVRVEAFTRSFSFAEHRDLALMLALTLTGRAENRQPPLTSVEAAEEVGIPELLASEELAKLATIGVAVPAGDGARGYMLAAPPDKIVVGEVVRGWEELRGPGGAEGRGLEFPALGEVKKRVSVSCMEGLEVTLRELWKDIPRDQAKEKG